MVFSMHALYTLYLVILLVPGLAKVEPLLSRAP